MTYFDKVVENKNDIKVVLKKTINNKTLSVQWFFSTNLHIDFGICEDFMLSCNTRKKKVVNRRIQLYQKATGRKFKLNGVDNCKDYTRLIYELK